MKSAKNDEHMLVLHPICPQLNSENKHAHTHPCVHTHTHTPNECLLTQKQTQFQFSTVNLTQVKV